jgi:hypothetical protein
MRFRRVFYHGLMKGTSSITIGSLPGSTVLHEPPHSSLAKDAPLYKRSLFADDRIGVTLVSHGIWSAQNNWQHKHLNSMKPSMKRSSQFSPLPAIMAMTCSDGVLLAASSRVSTDTPLALFDLHRISFIAPNIYFCHSNSLSTGQTIHRMTRP